MLMNGKEVNHLVINGETFDKSCVGKRAKIVATKGDNSNNIYMGIRVNADGSISSDTSDGYYHTAKIGDECVTIASYKNVFYITNITGDSWHGSNHSGDGVGQGWLKKENLQFLD